MPTTSLGTISTDLSHAETILQIADSLDHLEVITQKLFQGLKQHIDKNLSKLENIDGRIKIAGEKVDALREKKQRSATCLYASAKFPAPEYRDYESCLPDGGFGINRKQTLLSQKSIRFNNNPERGLEPKDFKEKLHFYHVKPQPKAALLFEPAPPKTPSLDLWSSASYLLFNTAENPFGNQGYINPLEAVSKKSKIGKSDSTERHGLQEAPSSLSKATGLDSAFNDNLYIPDLGDLPDFELPDELPDLPGIAQNSGYDDDFQDLPDIPIFDTKGPEIRTASPPPPPPVEMDKVIPTQQAYVPPPPIEAPPPVWMAEPQVAANTSVVLDAAPPLFDEPDGPVQKVSIAVDDTRSSLMEAIRLAGGSNKAGLKSVKEQKAAERKLKQETVSSVSGGGDLMSDLANKLALRRKGISGIQRPDAPGPSASKATGGRDSLSTISSLIPAPPPKTPARVADSDESEDDWN